MKERIKSIVLVILVIMNFILGSRVLSTKKLWSDLGYNFFSNIGNNPIAGVIRNIKDKFRNKPAAETHIEYPETIVINTGYQTSRVSLNRADDEFISLTALLKEFLVAAFAQPQKFTEVRIEDLYSILTAKSVYIHYPVSYDSSLFAYLLGVSSADFSQSFSELCEITVGADGSVYVQDSVTDKVYRCATNVPSSELNKIIDSHISATAQENMPVINYAFDLGFDKAFGSQKTVLSPMITIYSGDLELESAYARNPILKPDSSVSESCITDILRVFNMNPNALRRYTEADGTIVFVENNATLKISDDGLIDYNSIDGIALTKSSFEIQAGAILSLAGFVNDVNKASGSNSTMALSSSINSAALSSQKITLTLDYIVNGIPVKLKHNQFDTAASLTIEDGRLKSYRQILRAYTPSGRYVNIPNYISALDETIAEYEKQLNDIEIDSLNTAYQDDMTDGEITPIWNVEVNRIIIE